MTEARATLSNDQGDKWSMPPNSGASIPTTSKFNKAVVNQGKWIFYNVSYTGNVSASKVVEEGEGEVELGFVCASARETDYKADGICLFEHYNYAGKMETYTESESALTGFNSGVSSGVIFPSSRWNVYSEKSFRGIQAQRGPGNYNTAEALGLPNDTIQSVRRA